MGTADAPIRLCKASPLKVTVVLPCRKTMNANEFHTVDMNKETTDAISLPRCTAVRLRPPSRVTLARCNTDGKMGRWRAQGKEMRRCGGFQRAPRLRT